MSKFAEHGLPCPCSESSDAYAIDHNGRGHCFSCGLPEHKIREKHGLKEEDLAEEENEIKEDEGDYSEDIEFVYKAGRGLSKNTLEFYDVKTKVIDGKDYSWGFEYPNGAIKAKRIGNVPRSKKYEWKGEAVKASLFGSDKFDPSKYKTVVVTEGEHDCMTFYEASGGRVAAVSVQSAVVALRDIEADRDFLNRFEKIVIAFDKDDPGQEALRKVMSSGLFDFNKMYYVAFDEYKDANEYAQNGKLPELQRLLKAARKYTPDNIISTFEEIKKALSESHEDEIGTYPTDRLNEMLYGLHRGDVVIIKGMEGIGKTEIFRMMEHHLLKTTECKLGLIHMEEDKSTTIKGVATYELGVPCNLPDSSVSEEDILKGYQSAVSGDESRLHLYTMFGGDDPDDILDSIRFLVASVGVDVVFLDHITMMVTGTEEGDERRKLDYMSTKLKKMCKELRFCLVMISHVNDDGQTRGSRNITKIANTVLHLDRDKLADDPVDKNSLFVTVEKNRMTGRTGKAGQLFFNPNTFKLEETNRD